MADPKTRFTTDTMVLRVESGKLILPAAIAQRIENLELTSEGTLKTVRGPVPIVHDYKSTQDGSNFPFAGGYGNIHGIFHCLLQQETRSVYLLHREDKIYTFQGWDHTSEPWKVLIGTSADGGYLTAELPNDLRPRFPTQFEATPTGVVIVPQGASRAYFYNGETILPLGYSTTPAAPMGYGPETEQTQFPNGRGYSITAVKTPTSFAAIDSEANAFGDQLVEYSQWNLHKDFGYGRIGTVDATPTTSITGGTLFEGAWQGAIQWMDYFGNLSPISPRSNSIMFHTESTAILVEAVGESLTTDIAFDPTLTLPVDSLLKEIAWTGLDTGPEGTIGRVFLRTKDTKASSSDLFVVPTNVGFGTMAGLTTIPDNATTILPDNVPDAWLVSKPTDVRPVPSFKLCRLSMGRLWIANTAENPGEVIPSLPGLYGTFESIAGITPDPGGGEITGLWSVGGGLLVFTRTSTYLITPNSDGTDFRASTLHANVGCVAPSSIAGLDDGSAIWLGVRGFYMFSGQSIQPISDVVQPLIDRINPGRAMEACAVFEPISREYRCWVPLDGSATNNMCLIYNQEGWRRRTHEQLQTVCVTKDHQENILGGGTVPTPIGTLEAGVWVLDHASTSFTPKDPETIIETAWIEWGRSMSRKSAKTVYLALRESEKGAATIEVYRDWRITGTPTYLDTSNASLYSPEDIPNFWDGTQWNGTDSSGNTVEWSKRRPYWKRVDIDIPSCEVYKIIIRSTSRIEFLGMAVDEEPKTGGFGTRIP